MAKTPPLVHTITDLFTVWVAMCRQVASKLLLLVTIVQLPCKADGLVIMCYCKSIFFFQASSYGLVA